MFMQPLFEADKGGDGGGATDPNTGPNGVGGNIDEDEGDGKQIETNEGGEKTFTQAELEAIVKDRLAREKRKADEKAEQARKEAERKALEEQGNYKEMYKQLQKDLAEKDKAVLEIKKETLLLGAGYTQEQVDRYKKYVNGTTEEELATALEVLKADIPPNASNYVDPATQGNGQRQQQQQQDPTEYGKNLFKKLKEKGRIR